ncbi:serine/threonine protein kinase, CMGC, CDC2/CDK sub [Entomophthora muscae]|uniref:Serine/threonine protein kinase, CMGC, CDC2/CDK sub n=1 Tax=Entomophthora muscae TaxID=34485 RepID=A0ACC2RGD9_9FUNG|nr:serine/threonine protein kinase, CMGC, CDC2/CDK sub [Entomophthora muscae]
MRKKIIHRDLKVANLLVNNKGILKIADFGLSRYSLAAEDLTLCVVTRWYRPPEILLGAKNYSFPIDLWGVGCILAQMLTSEPLLPGKDDIGQLSLIFELCGAPTDETMPGWRNLPSASSINPGLGSHSRIRERLRGYDSQAIDLIERFLTLDPNKRITAKEALEHPFFSSPPLPAHPSCLPSLPSSHEMDNQGSRAERRPMPYDPYRRPQAKVSPTSHPNGSSQQRHHNSRADDYLHGQRADNRNHRSGRRASRERYSKASGSRGPSDSHNSHRNHSYKDGNRHRSGGSHNRRR